ncbi:hypothetical protein B0H10DRAFT_2450724 [Mycena sp. CBHHK59/15]|nr:hypothetical protein B0H10DRAFT_2450724 [Mycena sp. CBHHK59/15]
MSASSFSPVNSVIGVLSLLGMLPLATNLLATGLIAYKAYACAAPLARFTLASSLLSSLGLTAAAAAHTHPELWSSEFWTKIGLSALLVLAGGVFAGCNRIPIIGSGFAAVALSTTAIVIFGSALPPRFYTATIAYLDSITLSHSETIPQALSVRYGRAIGSACALAVLALMYLFAPLAWPIAKLLDWALDVGDHGHTYKKAEWKSFLAFHRTGEEPLRDDEIGILNAVLELIAKSVEVIMTPMNDVVTLSADAILDDQLVETIPCSLSLPALSFLSICDVVTLSVDAILDDQLVETIPSCSFSLSFCATTLSSAVLIYRGTQSQRLPPEPNTRARTQPTVSGYSRFPVHEPGHPDAFIGLLSIKKLLKYDPARARCTSGWRPLLPEVPATPYDLTGHPWLVQRPVSSFPLSILPDPSISCFQALDHFLIFPFPAHLLFAPNATPTVR